MKTAVYGIESIKFAETPTDGKFPTVWTAFQMKAIVKDSFSYNDAAPGETNIEVEDMDDYYAILQSDKGTKGFTVQTYDLSEEAYKFFFGYVDGEGDNEGYFAEKPGFELTNKAVQITTKAFADFPAKVFEWANMKLSVTKSGTIGKSGFPNLNIEFKKQAFVGTDGTEIAGARWKVLNA